MQLLRFSIVIMMRNLAPFLIMLTLLSFEGCKTGSNKQKIAKFDRIDSLRATFLTIEDSLLHAWNVMIHDDDERISDLQRLLDEVKYTGEADGAMIVQYKESLEKLKNTRYTLMQLKSEQIDEYDFASQSLTNEIISFAAPFNKKGNNPYIDELTSDVRNRESKVLFYRVDYDDFAKLHNQFIEDHQDIIKQIDQENEHIRLTLFEIAAN